MEASPDVNVFLFTDIEGSTSKWETEARPHGAGAGAARRAAARRRRGPPRTGDQDHRRRHLRGVRRRRGRGAGGRRVPARAGRSGSHGRHGDPRALRPARGPAVERDDDFFGTTVNRTARIMGVGHGGQVLLSAGGRRPRSATACRQSCRCATSVPSGSRTSPRRSTSTSSSTRGCAHEFPPLRSLEATPNNLPQQLTSFVGRERELAEAKELLGKTRLLTLLGMGGLGKTRLSLQIAADLLDEYPDGVWFVDLAPITRSVARPERGGAGPRRARGAGQAADADALPRTSSRASCS